MRIWLPLGLFIAGAVTVATVVFAGERLTFEAQALLMRSTAFQGPDATPEPPEVMIECDKPDCEAGVIYYEIVVDGTGRPRAIRFDAAIMPDPTGRPGLTRFKVKIPVLKPSIYTRAAEAALAARWPVPESGRPFRAFQGVSVVPPERLPSRHLPFPDTDGQSVSITLERVGPYSPYGAYVVTLDSGGDIDFCGPGYLKAPGPHQSRINPAAFDALVGKFRAADFFSLDDRYLANPGDGPTYYLRLRIGDQEKTVVDYSGRTVGMPAVVRNLQKAVDEAAGTSRWVGSQDEWGSHGAEVNCPTPFSGIRLRATQF